MYSESQQWAKLLGIVHDGPPIEICARFEQLAQTLASDLNGLPVYCVLSDLSPAFTGCYDCLQYYAIREQLTTDRGPGVVLVVSRSLLERVPPQNAVEAVCLVLSHELGHALCSLACGEFQDWHDAFADVREWPALRSAATKRFAPMTDPSCTSIEPQLAAHGLDFTRTMAHLGYRLSRHGIINEHVAAGARYQQRDYEECIAVLGNELAACYGKSFSEILALPMPEAFEACYLAKD